MHVGKRQDKEGDTVFSMSDVDEIKALKPEDTETAGLLHCFRVSQPPMHVVRPPHAPHRFAPLSPRACGHAGSPLHLLSRCSIRRQRARSGDRAVPQVLQCSCEEERVKWIDGLRARVDYWKQKRVEEGCVVAVTAKSVRKRGQQSSQLAESPSFGTGTTGGFPLPSPPPRAPLQSRTNANDATSALGIVEEAAVSSGANGGPAISMRAAAEAAAAEEQSSDEESETEPTASSRSRRRNTAWK